MGRKKAFTLVEILIGLCILGVLSTLSLYFYQYFIDKSKSAEAIINAGTIRKAEEMHKIETGSYVAASDIKQINDLLALDIVPKYYEYQVVGVTEDNFIIIANRIGEDIGLGKNVLAMNKSELMSSGYEPYIPSGGGGWGSGSSGSSGAGTSGGVGGGGLGTGSAGGGGSGGAGGGGSGGGGSGGAGGGGSGGSGGGSGGTGGGGSGGGSGTTVDVGGGSSAPVEISLVLDVLQSSTSGSYYYDLIQDNDITVSFNSDLGSGVLGQWIPTYWLDFYPDASVVPNTIYINTLLSTTWAAEAIAAVLIHEALHADYNYYTDKWVTATTERYGIDSSELSWVMDPVTGDYVLIDSIDQEYNAFVQAALFWQEVKGSKVNSEMDYILALYEQGGSELMDAVTAAYAGYPPYAKELQ